MTFSDFLTSYPGMYVTQSFFHALIAGIFVDRAIRAWDVTNPFLKQRFHFITVLLPTFSFPLYQIINPERGSISFRLDALFDANRWLTISLFGKLPLGVFLVAILGITTLIFLVQEMVPIVRHMLESKEREREEKPADDNPLIRQAFRNLPGNRPDAFLIDDDEDPIIFSLTGKKPALLFSTGLLTALTEDELEAAVAHELAHIERDRRPLLIAIFFVRILMFFNPAVLLEFRRAVQEEEMICDEIAASRTGKAAALAATLRKLYYEPEHENPMQAAKLSTLKTSLEEYSHNVHIRERIVRLEQFGSRETRGGWTPFLLTLIVIIVINYFVV